MQVHFTQDCQERVSVLAERPTVCGNPGAQPGSGTILIRTTWGTTGRASFVLSEEEAQRVYDLLGAALQDVDSPDHYM